MWRRRGAPGLVECGSEIIRWQLEMRNSGNELWIRSGRRSEAMAHFVFFCGLLLATAFVVNFFLFSFFILSHFSLSWCLPSKSKRNGNRCFHIQYLFYLFGLFRTTYCGVWAVDTFQ